MPPFQPRLDGEPVRDGLDGLVVVLRRRHPDVDQHGAAGSHHADELAHGVSPRRDQVQDVRGVRRTERPAAERQPCRVRDHERERRTPVRLLDQAIQHRAGEVHADEGNAGRRERKRDPAGADADLERTAPPPQLGREQVVDVLGRVRRERPGVVVEGRGAIERNGSRVVGHRSSTASMIRSNTSSSDPTPSTSISRSP